MHRTIWGILVMSWLAVTGAHATCRIAMDGEFPLQPDPTRVLIKGAANDKPQLFIVDTGAWASFISVSAAHKLNIHLDDARGPESSGIGGRVANGIGHFDMKLGELTLHDEGITVLAMKPWDHDDPPTIGRTLLAQHDLELDVPDNVIRIMEPHGCSPSDLPYWNKPYTLTSLVGSNSRTPAMLVEVKLNGHQVLAEIDSGTPHSTVIPSVVRGVDISKIPVAEDIGGIGARRLPARVVRFDTFSIGEETIRNAKIIVADIWKYDKTEATGTRLGSTTADTWQPSMLLGADFLRAHRVFVSYSMNVVVLSYTGGPVFDTSVNSTDESARKGEGASK